MQTFLTKGHLAIAMLWLLTTGANGIAQDIQVNQVDHNLGTIDNSTVQSETSHSVDGSRIVATWNDSSEFATGGLMGLTSLTGFGFSQDGGATFTDSGLLAPPTGFILTGDPGIVVDNSGEFYFSTMAINGLGDSNGNIGVAASTSTSPNVTFGNVVLIPRFNTGGSIDKELLAVDKSGGAFDGRVYVAWTEFVGSSGRMIFSRSTSTSPLAFSAPVQLSPSDTAVHQGTNLAVGPSGEVYVVWGRYVFAGSSVSSQEIHVVRSNDGGVTFANPDATDPAATKTIASPAPTPDLMTSNGINVRTRCFPYVAVDSTPIGSPTRGNVYVVFQSDPDGSDPDRSDIFFTRSTDGGATWSALRSITSGPGVTLGRDLTDNDNWQPTIAVSDRGEINVSFYDRREDTGTGDGDPANTQMRIYRALSTDGGTTWCNEPLSSVAFAPSVGFDPIIVSTYMGDYNWGTADGNEFQFSWGDCRNLVTNPPGAPSPATPSGRGDQDVFYRSVPEVSGPDLFIQPWGYVSGEGPRWQTPSIFVVDAANTVVNATKGQLNTLRAVVSNIGNATATDATITFKFAPWFAGISPSALKTIGTVTETLSVGQTKTVEVTWDLTDLTDDNGGLWPNPISDFTHFCVKVEVEHPGDQYLCNNIAQNNFNDVPTITGSSPIRFMIGNPFEKAGRAQLRVSDLPKGFTIRSEDDQLKFNEPFPIKANEIRTVGLTITPPEGFESRRIKKDVVAHIDMLVNEEIIGGLSIRLARAQESKGRNIEVVKFKEREDKLFELILAMLKERDVPVSLANPKSFLINTGPVNLNRRQLQTATDEDEHKRISRDGGRYIASFKVTKSDDGSQVEIAVLILAEAPVGSMLGGTPMPSSGALERSFLDDLKKRLAQ